MNATKQMLSIEEINATELLELFRKEINSSLDERIKRLEHTKAPDFITREDVAKMFGITLPTVHAWINAGILTPYKIGHRTRFKLDEVLATPTAIKSGLNND